LEQIVPFAFEPLMTEEELSEREVTISNGKQAFIAVGKALQDINERRGYRFTHSTFADYVEQRWGMSISSGYNMMAAAQVVENVQPVGQIDYTKAVALSRLTPDEQRDFVDEHDIKEMTKREIEKAVSEWKQRAEQAEREAKKAKEELAATEADAASIIERDRKLHEENERLKREKNPEPQVIVETKVVEPDDYGDLKQQVKQQSEQILAHTRHEVQQANCYKVRDSIHDLTRTVGNFLNKVKLNVREYEEDLVSDSELFNTATGAADILREAADYLDSLIQAKTNARKDVVWDAEFADVT
jgi:hypothetical protein